MDVIRGKQHDYYVQFGESLVVVGDGLTIDGVYQNVPNPDRKWWQLWKPRHVSRGPQTFVVTGVTTSMLETTPTT